MSFTHTHHLPASPHTVVSHGAPETERQTLGFGFLPQPHPPRPALANARAPCCHRSINLHPPPPSITPRCHFTLHARNRVTNARFRFFGLNPAPSPRLDKHPAPPPPSCHSPAPTTSQSHPTPPSHAARLKPSHKRSVSGFWPQPPPLPRNLRTHHPTTTTSLYAPPHHLPPSPPGAISDGAPKTEPQRLGFGLSAKIPPGSFLLSFFLLLHLAVPY